MTKRITFRVVIITTFICLICCMFITKYERKIEIIVEGSPAFEISLVTKKNEKIAEKKKTTEKSSSKKQTYLDGSLYISNLLYINLKKD